MTGFGSSSVPDAEVVPSKVPCGQAGCAGLMDWIWSPCEGGVEYELRCTTCKKNAEGLLPPKVFASSFKTHSGHAMTVAFSLKVFKFAWQRPTDIIKIGPWHQLVKN
eukprot:g39552.t1